MKIEKENIGWIDLLRVIACFLVVVSHSCDPFVAIFDSSNSVFLTGVFTGSLVRACVPLFVMMSAVLLLPIHTDMGTFYRKRIGRLLMPLIFWSLVLPFFYYFYLNFLGTQSPHIDISNFTLEATMRKLYTFIFNFTHDTIPFWYLYMLIGLYLIMPILSAWLTQASQKDLKIFISVWIFTLFIPYIKMFAPSLGYQGNYGNMGLFGVCDWNESGSFYYVTGFIGYLVLTYYLVKYPLNWSLKKTLTINTTLFVVGYLITSLGFLKTHACFPADYSKLEIVWYFSGINVFMMTFAIFVTVQKMKIASSRWLSQMASLSFGIYLCHFFFVQIGYDFIAHSSPFPTWVTILLIAIAAFLVSALLTLILQQFKITRRFVA